jgi:vitamin B12 transporter
MSVFRVGRNGALPVLVAALAVSAGAMAEEILDEVVVTANRTATTLDRVGGSVTVITDQAIENRQATKVEDILKNTPGVSMQRSGGQGALTQLNLRGTDSSHSTVLIDGQRMNFQDPASNTFDFDWLTTDNIERIEVLRGPAAGQWGGDTIGGVINIVTKKGKGPMKVTASAEGGSFGTNRESVTALGGGERYDYAFGWSNFFTSGWSTAPKQRGWGTEPDGSSNMTTFIKLGFSPTDNSEVEARYTHTDFSSHSDGVSFGGRPAGQTGDTHILKYKHVDSGHIKGRMSLFDGFWTPSVSASTIHNDQWNMGSTSTTAGAGCTNGAISGTAPLCSAYDAWSHNLGFQNDLKFDADNTLTFGADSTTETYWQKNYQQAGRVVADRYDMINSGYVQHQTRLFEALDLLAGYRGGQHNTFGLYSTYFGTAAWHLPTGTTLKGSFGTSFKAPSLYQIYYPSNLSNPSLQPEKGRGWDIGFEQKLVGNTLKVGSTFFRNDIVNLVESVVVGALRQYQNVSKATTQGVEMFVDYRVFDDSDGSLTLTPNYTYTQAYKRAGFEELTRRPRHALGGDITWKFLEKRGRLNFSAAYNSDHQETRPTTATAAYPNRAGGYAQFDLAGSYDVTDNLQLFARLENMFDRYHEENFGYASTGGRAFFAGVKVSFEPVKLMGGDGK